MPHNIIIWQRQLPFLEFSLQCAFYNSQQVIVGSVSKGLRAIKKLYVYEFNSAKMLMLIIYMCIHMFTSAYLIDNI